MSEYSPEYPASQVPPGAYPPYGKDDEYEDLRGELRITDYHDKIRQNSENKEFLSAALYRAIKDNDTSSVRLVIDLGANPNQMYIIPQTGNPKRGYFAFDAMTVAIGVSVTMVQILIDRKATVSNVHLKRVITDGLRDEKTTIILIELLVLHGAELNGIVDNRSMLDWATKPSMSYHCSPVEFVVDYLKSKGVEYNAQGI